MQEAGAARQKDVTLGRGMKVLRSVVATAAALGFVLAPDVAARAQAPGSPDILSIDRIGYVEPGSYQAGDSVRFELDAAGGNYLLRFKGSPEVFVLYADHGSLGGRILKYDSGETALNVSGWGGITLYTDQAPQGLPAVRTGDSLPPSPAAISLQDMQSAAGDEAERLAYVRRVAVQFTTDWNALADNAALRAFAFDALENAARGIERYCGGGGARDAFVRRISVVVVAQGSRPTLGINGRSLIVTFNAGRGYEGRASSRAIARALGHLLGR